MTAITWTLYFLAIPLQAPPDDQEAIVRDEDITSALEREYVHDGAVPSDGIDVVTDNGIVLLSGDVDDLLAKERAARIAETVKGVRSVVNRIRVDLPEERDDVSIADDIREALLLDPAADSYEVAVSVRDGNAVLSGTVDSWRERQLCENVAKGVRGVREITDQIRIAHDPERTDAEILSEIEGALHWSTLVDDTLIDVRVDDGNVTLVGVVGSAAEKRLARGNAWTAGVHSVSDDGLQVRRWARDEDLRERKYVPREDAEIRSAVVEALAHDPRVSSFNVLATVEDGCLTLRGVVDNLKAKRAGAQDARCTVGVNRVSNLLKVRPSEERDGATIAADVRGTFRRDPWIDPEEIAVDVEGGVVRLDGVVDSLYERLQADDLAARVRGVVDVRNDLRVRGRAYPASDPFVDRWSLLDLELPLEPQRMPSLTDAQLAEDVRDELYWSPFVDSGDVHVSVLDGVATLSGTVESRMERGAAVDNAYEAGCSRVRDRLKLAGKDAGGAVQ